MRLNTTPYFKKYIIPLVTIGLIASAIALYLRTYTLRFHFSEDAQEHATLTVLNNLRKTTLEQISKTNPGLSPQEKNRLAQKEFNTILKTEGPKIRLTIDDVAQKMDTLNPPADNPFYLMEADSYYYYDLTKTILEKGKISEHIRGSKYFNSLMMAPEGFWEPLNLHPYIGAYIFRFLEAFKPDLSLMEGLSYTPLIITMLIVFTFAAGTLILECHPVVGLLSAIYFVCVPIFVRRSMFGWYKNDPINIFFLLLITVVFLYGLKHLNDRKRTIYTAAILCFLLALYSLFWQGWVFMASLIFFSTPLLFIISQWFLRTPGITKNLLIYSSIIILGSFLGVSVVFGPSDFFILFKEGWTALQEFLNPGLPLWPDMYIAVSELLPPKMDQWLSALGGIAFMLIAALGLLSRIYHPFTKLSINQRLMMVPLALFAILTIKLSLSAQRFETLCLIPLSLLFALGLQFLYEGITPHIVKKLIFIRDSKFSQWALIGGVIGLLAYIPVSSTLRQTPYLLNKIFNKTWDTALTKMNRETPPNSIINSWWPPGHFIKAIAHRSVTFDGATINKPQAYWLANVFTATDEKQALGILRMLNSSANQATEYLLKEGFPLSEAVDLIKQIVLLSQDDAAAYLKDKLTNTQLTQLITLTHGTPPSSYILLYQEMAEDQVHFSFISHWDFKKVETINQNPELKALIPKRNSKDYVPYLWKITSSPPRYSGVLPAITENESIVRFENNIQVNLKTMDCQINSPRFGQGTPKSLLYIKNNTLYEQTFSRATLPYSVMLIKDGRGYKCILADTWLANSLLMRLYFYQGKGLKYIEPFIDEQDLTGRTHILVYKVNWEKLLTSYRDRSRPGSTPR